MLNIDISNLTEEQSKIITECYSVLKKIPIIHYRGMYDWKKTPHFVFRIVEFFRDSKMELSDFARRIGLERNTLYYFNEGMDHNGVQWNDLNFYINKLNQKTPNVSKLIAENGALKAKLGTLVSQKSRNNFDQKSNFPRYLAPISKSNILKDPPKSLNTQIIKSVPSSDFVNIENYIKSEIQKYKNTFATRLPWSRKPYLVALLCKDFYQTNYESLILFCKKYQIPSSSFVYYLRGFRTSNSKSNECKEWSELILELKNLNIDIYTLREKVNKLINTRPVRQSIQHKTENNENVDRCTSHQKSVLISASSQTKLTATSDQKTSQIVNHPVNSSQQPAKNYCDLIDFKSLPLEDRLKIQNNQFEILNYIFNPEGNIIATIRL